MVRVRIGIDITSANATRTGIGSYTWEVVRRLWAHGRQEHDFVFLFNSTRQNPPRVALHKSVGDHLRLRRIPGPAILQMWRWMDRPPVEEFAGEVDVFHSPATYIPPQRKGAGVTTVHDLHFLDNPEEPQHALGGEYIAWVLGRRLPDVQAVICPSRLTADSLMRHYGGAVRGLEERIHVMPWGVHKRFFGVPGRERVASVRACHALDRPYILVVGGSEPRKNIPMVQKAHSILCERMPDCPTLAVAGGTTMAGKAGVHTRLLGYVREPDLLTLYHSAELFVCPSRMEGFGMPILEAMAAGIPVVCTRTAGCLEFTEPGAAVAVDPFDADGIAHAIERVLTDSALRAGLVEAGLRSARALTWDACAKATLDVYRRAAELAPRR